MSRALELCEDHGGARRARGTPARRRRPRGSAEGAWRDAFLQAPYLRDTLVAAGIFAETFETAVTWDRFPSSSRPCKERAREALEVTGP